MRKLAFLFFCPFLFFAAEGLAKIKLQSVFSEGGVIPARYTCDGENISPRLEIEGEIPQGIKSLALVLSDPDAPGGTFIHWVLYDISPKTRTFPENFPKKKEEKGVKQARNDFGEYGYGGPCPPPRHGFHRYFFTLYFLPVSSLGLLPEEGNRKIVQAIQKKSVRKVSVMGKYRR